MKSCELCVRNVVCQYKSQIRRYMVDPHHTIYDCMDRKIFTGFDSQRNNPFKMIIFLLPSEIYLRFDLLLLLTSDFLINFYPINDFVNKIKRCETLNALQSN